MGAPIDKDLFETLNTAEDKLADTLFKNEWSMQVEKDTYPIVFRFRKGINSFLVPWDETTPQIEFSCRNVLYVSCVPEQYKVDEKFLNKLKNFCKEICRLYVLIQFSRREARFETAFKELWTTEKGDRVGIIRRGYRP